MLNSKFIEMKRALLLLSLFGLIIINVGAQNKFTADTTKISKDTSNPMNFSVLRNFLLQKLLLQAVLNSIREQE